MPVDFICTWMGRTMPVPNRNAGPIAKANSDTLPLCARTKPSPYLYLAQATPMGLNSVQCRVCWAVSEAPRPCPGVDPGAPLDWIYVLQCCR